MHCRQIFGPENGVCNFLALVKIYGMLILQICAFSPPGPVVQRVDNAIHRINHYPVDRIVCFINTYPLESDLSGG